MDAAPPRWDVIVVGAGPAGCAAAWDLAATGRRVLLLDRRGFPRVKPCAGGLTPRTLRRLRYDVGPVIRQRCAEVEVGGGGGQPIRLGDGRTLCAMTVRAELDHFCLRRTVERGAELRERVRVAAVVEDARGVTVRTSAGELRAPWLVGADGANGVVRRTLRGAGPLATGFAIEARVATRDPPPMRLDFDAVPGGYGWLFPKGDHVSVGLYAAPPGRPGRDALAAYACARLGCAALEEMVGHHVAVGGGGARAGARVVLAGDAAGLVDPLLAEGIHSAVASGQAAAAALADAQEGEALERAYARRLRALRAELWVTGRVAATFYRHVRSGCRLMGTTVGRRSLVGAYAGGFTLSAPSALPALAPPPPSERSPAHAP